MTDLEKLQNDNERLISENHDLLEVCLQARACLLNLQPDTGPMARQMQKMVHEISVVIDPMVVQRAEAAKRRMISSGLEKLRVL